MSSLTILCSVNAHTRAFATASATAYSARNRIWFLGFCCFITYYFKNLFIGTKTRRSMKYNATVNSISQQILQSCRLKEVKLNCSHSNPKGDAAQHTQTLAANELWKAQCVKVWTSVKICLQDPVWHPKQCGPCHFSSHKQTKEYCGV